MNGSLDRSFSADMQNRKGVNPMRQTLIRLRAAGSWIDRLLNVRLPIAASNGIRRS